MSFYFTSTTLMMLHRSISPLLLANSSELVSPMIPQFQSQSFSSHLPLYFVTTIFLVLQLRRKRWQHVTVPAYSPPFPSPAPYNHITKLLPLLCPKHLVTVLYFHLIIITLQIYWKCKPRKKELWENKELLTHKLHPSENENFSYKYIFASHRNSVKYKPPP